MEIKLLKDFILIADNAFSKEECDILVNLYEDCKQLGWVQSRLEADNMTPDIKSDGAVSLYANMPLRNPTEIEGCGIQFNESLFGNMVLSKIYEATREHYSKKWSLLPVSTSLSGFSWKIQKTVKGEGYHVWHAEQSAEQMTRTLVWTVYLTDIDDDAGGETQFLYYPHSGKPKAGRIMIFPASFTHAHRGNIYWGSRPKYIATGWLYWNTPDALKERKQDAD
jgi:hypothetical protein